MNPSEPTRNPHAAWTAELKPGPHDGRTFRPFPVHLLPQPLRSFVLEAASAIGCDPSFIALPALAGCAGAIGNTRRVQIKGGWTEPAVLWCLTIARSGTQKSPGQEAAVAALQEKQLAALEEYDEALRAHEMLEADHEAALRDWRNTGRKKGEPQPARPECPTCPRILVSDVTAEAVADRLHDSPRGVVLERDELNGWLRSFDQYKGGRGGDVNHWLSMHRAGMLLVDRKTGDRKSIRVPRAAVSITGTIQPGTIARVLTPEYFENGLAARLLLAMPPKRRRTWSDAELSDTARASFAAIYHNLLALDFDRTGPDAASGRAPVIVRLAPDAAAAFQAFFNEHNREAFELSDDLAAAWSKLEAYAPRLALVLHCIRCAAGDTTINSPTTIDLASMEAGIALVRWFAHEARRVYAMLAESDEDRERRALIDYIRGRGGAISSHELGRGPRKYRNAGDPSEAAERDLMDLVREGWGEWVHNAPGTPGAPTRRLRLYPEDADTPAGAETPTDAHGSGGFVSAPALHDAAARVVDIRAKGERFPGEPEWKPLFLHNGKK